MQRSKKKIEHGFSSPVKGTLILVGGYMGGGDFLDVSEVVSLTPGVYCNDLRNYPFEAAGAQGTVVKGKFIVCGGVKSTNTSSEFHDQCYTYDPASQDWRGEHRLLESRAYAASVIRPDGNWWMIGGNGADFSHPVSTAVFDGLDWTHGGDFPIAIDSHCAVQAGENTLVFGGETEGAPLDSTFRYGPSAAWEEVTPMSQVRRYAGCARITDDLIMVVGGEDENKNVTDSVEYYTVSGDSFELVEQALPVKVAGITLVEQGGRILLVGGYSRDLNSLVYNDKVFEYQVASRTWVELPGVEVRIGRTAEVVVATDDDILGTCP